MIAPTLLRASLAAALLTGIAFVGLSATGALAESRSYDLAPFTAATFESDITAAIVVGSAQTITVEARSPEDLQDLRMEVVNGKLHAWVDRDFWDFVSFRDRHIVVTIAVPALDRLSADAGAEVSATGMTGDVAIDAGSGSHIDVAEIDALSARISASSGAEIKLDGVCVTATVESSSGASIGGKAFECGDVNVEASSGSNTTLFAKGHVNADASSGANVILAGNPAHVDDDVSSGADVTVLN